MSTAVEIARQVAVVGLLAAAAALATPPGRLPIALRSLARMLGRPAAVAGDAAKVSRGRRALALVLALVATVLCVWR